MLGGMGIKSLEHRQEMLSTILYLYCGFPTACDYLSSDAQSSGRDFENKISASESDRSDGGSFASSTHIDGIDRYFESESVSCINSTSPGNSCSTFSSSVYSPQSLGSNCRGDCEVNRLSMLAMADRKSCTSVEKRKPRMYQMSKNRGSHEKNVSFLHMSPVMSRKLLVRIIPEQDNDPEISKTRIRTRFQELNIRVEDVKEFGSKQNVYVVEFSDKKKALDALLRSEEIGYHIRWKWPKRPGPQNVRTFKAFIRLPIFSGKSLTKSKFKDWLPEGAIIRVNQLKRRRARLIKEDADGNNVIIGWVNMYAENGVRCLEQVDDR